MNQDYKPSDHADFEDPIDTKSETLPVSLYLILFADILLFGASSYAIYRLLT